MSTRQALVRGAIMGTIVGLTATLVGPAAAAPLFVLLNAWSIFDVRVRAEQAYLARRSEQLADEMGRNLARMRESLAEFQRAVDRL